ncbi:MAG TPA: hypothetical protein VLT61_07715 [Anaeromyxobacteraceae bacterium]|nr:hypothetical protein [Anaeromyxobacteraceae bacterium]
MTRATRSIAVLLALMLVAPVPAAAAAGRGPRVAIAPVRGDDRGRLGAQLASALCTSRRCVTDVLDVARPDLERARRAGADASLLASVWRERRGRVLSLALFTRSSRPARSWVLLLGPDGLIPGERLDAFVRELDDVLGVPTLPPARPPPPMEPSPMPMPMKQPPPPADDATEVRSGSRPPPLAGPAPSGPPAPAVHDSVEHGVVMEAGIEPTRRTLRFPEGGTAPVGYGVTMPSTPFVGLELHPFAGGGGRGAGLALFAEGSYLRDIELPSGTRTHLATFLAYRGGLLWRIPVAGRVALVPGIAWEHESFVVATAEGVKVPGLPDDRRTGPSAALGLEVPVGRRVTVLAGGRATIWTDARDLAGGEAFFPGGRAFTLQGEAGLALRLTPWLSLRALASWADTRWTLDPDPSGAYTVRSARAERLGGRVTLRLGH